MAAARYDELIARHPEAFADHAAEFWMSAGGGAKKALTLALRNLEVRRTPRAYELVLRAALACGEEAAACDAVVHTRAFGHLWPSLSALTTRAAASCS